MSAPTKAAPFSLIGVSLSSHGHHRPCPAPSALSRAHFSFGARGADRSWELSRPLNSMQDRQAARKREEFAAAVVDRVGWKT